MRLIAISSENHLVDENLLIEAALDSGIDYLHIRKPKSTKEQIRELLLSIDKGYYSRLVLHDHFSLVAEFPLGGLHLNQRNSAVPDGFSGRLSRSCHSFKELEENAELEYCTLSPIFDSISKKGYRSNFSMDELKQARLDGTVNERVIALGGVTVDNIPQIISLGFGGVALLSYLWDCENSASEILVADQIIKRVKLLRKYI